MRYEIVMRRGGLSLGTYEGEDEEGARFAATLAHEARLAGAVGRPVRIHGGALDGEIGELLGHDRARTYVVRLAATRLTCTVEWFDIEIL